MRHWVCLWKAGYGGGAYILCRLPTPPCRCPVGACFFGCLPPLPLAYFAAPLPRRGRISPRPALAERSSPVGKGETKVISCKGLRPLHPRGWTGQGASYSCRSDTQGTLRQEDRAQTIGFSQYSIFGKVLGGLGDSFKSPPAFSPAFSPSFPPFPRQMLSDGRGCGSVPAGA